VTAVDDAMTGPDNHDGVGGAASCGFAGSDVWLGMFFAIRIGVVGRGQLCRRCGMGMHNVRDHGREGGSGKQHREDNCEKPDEFQIKPDLCVSCGAARLTC
jgi:hypothetical protein